MYQFPISIHMPKGAHSKIYQADRVVDNDH